MSGPSSERGISGVEFIRSPVANSSAVVDM
jgi:hypothetical protein